MYHFKLNASPLAAFMGCTPVHSKAGLGLWKRQDVVSDVGFANLFSEKEDGRAVLVDLSVVKHDIVLRGLIEHVRSVGVEAEIHSTVASFIPTQKSFMDPVSGKLTRPHIRACLYAAD